MPETKIKQDFINNWKKIFRNQNEEALIEKIEDTDLQKLKEGDTDDREEFLSNLKNIASSQMGESYAESFVEELKAELGIKHDTDAFNIDQYDHLNKTRVAQEMADFCNYQINIRPVEIDNRGDQKHLFRYQPTNGYWDYFSKNKIGRMCKSLAGKKYSAHLEREFTRNLVNHGNYMKLEDMGLDDDRILLKNNQVLETSTEPPYETTRVEKEDMPLHKINVNYDPEADCPRFKTFVEQLLDGKENQIKTLQEFMGWLLKHPNNDYKKALLILGVTNSGKSQLADIVTELFTDKSVSNISLNQIGLERRFHIDSLKDKVVNIDRDMSVQYLESSDSVKLVISQENLRVEPKGEDGFTIRPRAKHLICSNVSPKPSNHNDEAFYGRFLTLKTPNTVPKEERETNLGEKLFEEEGSGILNWMLEGLERLERQGDFTLNPSPYETKLMWNEYGDSVQRFLWSCTEKGDVNTDFIPTSELYEEYEIWVEGKMLEKEKEQNFINRVKKQPYVKKERKLVNGENRKMCFFGLKLDSNSGNLANHN